MMRAREVYKGRRMIILPNGLRVELHWHSGYRHYLGLIYIETEFRYIQGSSRKDLFAKLRLALSRGTDDIFWDVKLLKRFKVGNN